MPISCVPSVPTMDILLLAGLWLPDTIWNETVDALEALGHRAIPVALPGVDDDSTTATLADQVEAVTSAIDTCDRPIVVGHSAACTLAWIAADQRPEAIRSVVLIGGFPGADGEKYADFFEVVDGVMGFPGWEPFEGPDSDDLDDAARDRIASQARPVPGAVAQGTVQLVDERRYGVPVVLVCPEYTPDDARAWIEAGDVPELARVNDVSYVDIDSGHWPMVSRPTDLAQLIADAAADST